MKIVMLSLAGLAGASAAIFVKMAWSEYMRLRFLRTSGARVKGCIIGEAPRRVGEAPLPVVRFEDSTGAIREFRSRFPRRTRGFIHPEEIEVLYHADEAEIATTVYATRWIGGIVAFAVVCISIGLLFVLLSLQ